MPKPTIVPRWSDASPSTTRDAPSEGEKNTGWGADEVPTHGIMNWLIGVICDWWIWVTSLIDFTDGIAVTGHVTATEHVTAGTHVKPTSAQDIILTGTAGLQVSNTAGTLKSVFAGKPLDYTGLIPRNFWEVAGKWRNGALAVGEASVRVPWDGTQYLANHLTLGDGGAGRIVLEDDTCDGWYEITVLLQWSNQSSAAARTCHIKVAGSEIDARADGNCYSAISQIGQSQEFTTLVHLASTSNYVEVYAESTLAGDGVLGAKCHIKRVTGDI